VPRRRELLAACAVAVMLAHLLLAPLSLVIAAVFILVSRISRWRLWWLAGPVAAGLVWIMLIGPGQALTDFAAWPASVLRHFGSDGSAARAGHPAAVISGIGSWLSQQLPLALPLAAAEAAVAGWLHWLHTDEWALPAPRPGAVAALRAAVATRRIRSGAVLTRDGFVLGVAPATGAAAGLDWAEISRGLLVAGADEREVTIACLQLVHAALRRRKAVFVLDDGQSPGIADALAAACRATGTPLHGDDHGDDRGLSGEAQKSSAAWAEGAPQADHAAQWGRVGRGGDASREWGAARAEGAARAGGGAWAEGAARAEGGARGGDSARKAGAGQAWDSARAEGLGQRGGGVLAGGAASASQLWGRAAAPERPDAGVTQGRLREMVSERSAALLTAVSPELAAGACTGLAVLAADLRRIGVDGDALVWIPHAERVPAQALGVLLSDGARGGLAVMLDTTSPASAADLGRLAGAALIRRITDPAFAGSLAVLTGTRLLPPQAVASPGFSQGFATSTGLGSARTAFESSPGFGSPARFAPGLGPSDGLAAAGLGPSAGLAASTGFGTPGGLAASTGFGTPGGLAAAAGLGSPGGFAAAAGLAPELVACPAVPARVLLELGPEDFVLAVGSPRPRLIAPGRLVPARLPHPEQPRSDQPPPEQQHRNQQHPYEPQPDRPLPDKRQPDEPHSGRSRAGWRRTAGGRRHGLGQGNTADDPVVAR
jgi:hypothetical protein